MHGSALYVRARRSTSEKPYKAKEADIPSTRVPLSGGCPVKLYFAGFLLVLASIVTLVPIHVPAQTSTASPYNPRVRPMVALTCRVSSRPSTRRPRISKRHSGVHQRI